MILVVRPLLTGRVKGMIGSPRHPLRFLPTPFARLEILRKTKLSPVAGAADGLPGEDSEIYRQTFSQLIISTDLFLQRLARQLGIDRMPPVDFDSEIEPRCKLPGKRTASREHRAPSLNSDGPREGIAGKGCAPIHPQRVPGRKISLDDAIEVVIDKPGAEPQFDIAGRRLNVQAGADGGPPGALLFMMEVVFDGVIGIAQSKRRDQSRALGVENCKEREVHAKLAIRKSAKAELDGLSVLAKAGIRDVRKEVELIVGFQMPAVIGGNVGIVGKKRLLRTRGQSRDCKRKNSQSAVQDVIQMRRPTGPLM